MGCPAAALDLTQMLLGTYLLYSAVGHGAASVFPSLYKVYWYFESMHHHYILFLFGSSLEKNDWQQSISPNSSCLGEEAPTEVRAAGVGPAALKAWAKLMLDRTPKYITKFEQLQTWRFDLWIHSNHQMKLKFEYFWEPLQKV